MYSKEDLTGKIFDLLTVEGYAYSQNGRRIWKCKCDCGNITYVKTSNLKNRNTKSCGCLKDKTKPNKKHNKSNLRLYKIWSMMKQRCKNPNAAKYKNYGGRGIKICKEWEKDFMNFYNWAINNGFDENKNRKEQSLDRINVNGNYEPSNCRWITQSENCRNRTNNKIITQNGVSKTIAEWSEELGIDQRTISYRAKKYTNIDDILSTKNLLRKKHKSNTGEFGISQDQKGKYQLHLNHKYIGQYKTLNEAIAKREEMI